MDASFSIVTALLLLEDRQIDCEKTKTRQYIEIEIPKP